MDAPDQRRVGRYRQFEVTDRLDGPDFPLQAKKTLSDIRQILPSTISDNALIESW